MLEKKKLKILENINLFMESFQPISNESPDTFFKKIKFYFRMLLDLQINTIYKDVKNVLLNYDGKVLDVGCGDSPYLFLLKDKSKYTGIDVNFANDFKYENRKVVYFDGINIPFGNEEFDQIICTEVLEHVFEYQALINEMYRVTKKGGAAIVTIPWSARFHYKPYDYFRYTPSTLEKIFSNFSEVQITPRGTDLVTICSKIIVAYFRNILKISLKSFIYLPFILLFSPFMPLVLLVAHISLQFNIGTNDDPLGYTIILKK